MKQVKNRLIYLLNIGGLKDKKEIKKHVILHVLMQIEQQDKFKKWSWCIYEKCQENRKREI